MVIFYVITITNLIVRMAIMISLNFRTFFATENLILSTVSLMLTLLTGTSHAKILVILLVDLQTLASTTQEEYDQTRRLKHKCRLTLLTWIVLLVGSAIFFFFSRSYEYAMLGYLVLFSLLATGLLIMNCKLNSTLTGIFNEESFSNERRFLQCTLAVFTLSYIVVFFRALAIAVLL